MMREMLEERGLLRIDTPAEIECDGYTDTVEDRLDIEREIVHYLRHEGRLR